MIPRDRIICAFVDDSMIQSHFKEWPLHITIVPWFRTDLSSSNLGMAITIALKEISPFEYKISTEARFGNRGTKVVNLIEVPSPFQKIEQTIRDILHIHESWIVDETTKLKRQFRPHVTIQHDQRVTEGETYLCEELYIVEQKGDHKEIVSRIHL